MVITDIYNDLLPFPLAHSIFPLHSANASADHSAFPLGMIQIFIYEVFGPLVVLSKLNSHSFPLTFFTRHGSTKSCPQEMILIINIIFIIFLVNKWPNFFSVIRIKLPTSAGSWKKQESSRKKHLFLLY